MFVNEHKEAINHDLIKCGFSLDDIGGSLTWDALGDFISKTETDSALARELDAETSRWATQMKTNEILADLYDLMAVFRAEVTGRLYGKRPKKTTPYKRPHKNEKKKIGKGALPKDDLRKWIKNKLKGSENRG